MEISEEYIQKSVSPPYDLHAKTFVDVRVDSYFVYPKREYDMGKYRNFEAHDIFKVHRRPYMTV